MAGSVQQAIALLLGVSPEDPLFGHEQEATVAAFDEGGWLRHLELKYALRALREELVRSVGRSVGAISTESAAPPSPVSVKEALSLVERLLASLAKIEVSKLAACEPNSHPLVLKLARRYGLSAAETDLFQLMFVLGASSSSSIRITLGGRQDVKELAMELCGMSLLEVEEFLDEKRTHVMEGVIVGQENYEGKTFRMMKEAVSVLLLRPITTDQWLKLSRTELLNIVESSEVTVEHASTAEPVTDQMDDLAEVGGGQKRKRKGADLSDDYLTKQADEVLASLECPRPAKRSHNVPSPETETSDGTIETCRASSKAKADLQEYTSSLEYLDDAFQVLCLMLRIAKARHKENVKDACDDEKGWYYDSYRTSKASSIRELQAKLRVATNKLQERMRSTEMAVKNKTGQFPRLEALVRKLGLDDFEKGVVLMLTGVSVSPVVRSVYQDGDGLGRFNEIVVVQDILTVYFTSFKEQVQARTYFYKSSKLVSRGVIKLRGIRPRGDLMDQHVELDRRMLDWIVGLDTEMNELVDGSFLYTPKVSMEQVVLPEDQKSMLLKTVDNFDKFKEFRKSAGLEDVVSYGAGLVILLCGASGTGKTMTVNAIAHHLGKRVLLVDFNALYVSSSGSGMGREDTSGDIRGLFRDADMNDAVIFFDECEAIFAQREHGGDKVLSILLSEMERYEGIVMLATNRPQDLDEAMHRRITCVSEFHPPDHNQRREIWKVSSSRLPLTENVNWDVIALRYELTGGYIKNALVSALLMAISRDSSKPAVTEADIIEGCRLQMRGNLQMKSFTHKVVPKVGMDDLVLNAAMREQLEGIVRFEKARAILQGQWGFEHERLGTACLFFGSHGTGKSAAAEALGFELGRPLKVINCGQLISVEKPKEQKITSIFKDARLMDAVLVLEDFQVMGAEEEGLSSVSAWSSVSIGLLLHELERFPGICILVANVAQGNMIVRLHQELVRRLRFVVEFKMPDQTIRAAMWKKMLPEKAPVASDINFEELAKRFEFSSGAICSATVRAAAMAALRSGDACIIKQKDLLEAAEAERAHLRDEVQEIMMRAFI